MTKELAQELAGYMWRLRDILEKVQPMGELASSAGVLARVADRYATGASELKSSRVDAACSSLASELAAEIQASGIKENWLVGDLRCFSEALQIAAYLEAQIPQADIISDAYARQVRADAGKQYEAAMDCLKRHRS